MNGRLVNVTNNWYDADRVLRRCSGNYVTRKFNEQNLRKYIGRNSKNLSYKSSDKVLC